MLQKVIIPKKSHFENPDQFIVISMRFDKNLTPIIRCKLSEIIVHL